MGVVEEIGVEAEIRLWLCLSRGGVMTLDEIGRVSQELWEMGDGNWKMGTGR